MITKPKPARAKPIRGAMKLRHAAALALVGWYLMLPPANPANFSRTASVIQVIKDSSDLDAAAKAPLGEWTIESGYDRAAECNAVHERRMDDWGTKFSKDAQAIYFRMMKYYTLSQCVASDDPRLKPK